MGRPTHEPKHLLDVDAEQNIGNSTNLQPQDGGGPVGGTVTPQTNPERILMLSGPSSAAKTTSVTFTAARLTGSANNPSPGYAGPVTGIVEFGNGGRSTKVEFDVPVGPFIGVFQGAASNTEPQDGGTVVTLPTGVLLAYARYDNRLIQPLLGTVPPLSMAQVLLAVSPTTAAQVLGIPFAGPGGPVGAPAPAASVAPAEPILVKAMAAYYTRHYAKLFKTQYCYVGAPGAPAQAVPQVKVLNPSLSVAPGLYCVPAFARNLRVLRNPPVAVTVELFDGLYNGNAASVAPLDTVNVLANTTPEIPVVGTETIVRVSTATSNDKVTLLALCYEIGL